MGSKQQNAHHLGFWHSEWFIFLRICAIGYIKSVIISKVKTKSSKYRLPKCSRISSIKPRKTFKTPLFSLCHVLPFMTVNGWIVTKWLCVHTLDHRWDRCVCVRDRKTRYESTIENWHWPYWNTRQPRRNSTPKRENSCLPKDLNLKHCDLKA